jgi:hypothetical protein
MGLLDVESSSIQEKPKLESVKADSSWLSSEKETILIYGQAKVGKTWAYCSIIEDIINKGGKVFIINTDGGISKTFKQYFSKRPELLEKATKGIEYYFLGDIGKIVSIIKDIKSKVKATDVVVIDLVSDFWEMAQHKFMEEVAGENIVGFIERASKDKKSFGLLDSNKWQYVKKLDNYILEHLVVAPVCHVIGVAAQKDLAMERIMGGEIKSVEFEAAGAKPAGQPQLSYKFNTIVFLGITKNQRYFQIMGDRGATTKQTMVSYNENFWNKFQEEREKRY